MFASLPMYDSTSTRAANDRFWTLVREEYGDGPEKLSRDRDLQSSWEAPDLLLSQTCGLPYRARLHDRVSYVCTPDYGLRGCPPGYYRSIIVARRDDPRRRLADFAGGTLARNDAMSQSGWASIVDCLAGLDPGARPGAVIDTGAHAASAAAVAEGRADLAAIDAVTWTLLKRESDIAERLRPLARTRPTPGLPFITAAKVDPVPLRAALERALARLPRRDRARLLIKRLVRIPPEAYLTLPIPAREI